MKKQEITLYGFNELSEDVQEKLLKDEIDSEREFFCDECLYDNLLEDVTGELFSLFENVKNVRLLYDFSYSQGSGLLTEFEFTFKNQLVKVRQNPQNHWYTYSSNFILEFEDEEPITDEDEKEIRQKITSLNDKYQTIGYSCIEDEEYFKEEAKDYLESLDEVFTKSGKYFQE